MVTRRYEQPFHTVVLSYDESRSETAYEKQLVEKYLGFLNEQQKMSETIKHLTSEYYREQFLWEGCTTGKERMEELFAPLFEAAGKMKESSTLIPDEYLKLKKDFERIFSEYQNYHTMFIDIFRDCMMANDEKFNVLFAWFEDEKDGEAFEEFDRFANELYKNYNDYSLDLCRFDEDVDDMKSQWQNLSKEWDTLFELRETTVKQSKCFSVELDELNKKITQLQIDLRDMDISWGAFNN